MNIVFMLLSMCESSYNIIIVNGKYKLQYWCSPVCHCIYKAYQHTHLVVQFWETWNNKQNLINAMISQPVKSQMTYMLCCTFSYKMHQTKSNSVFAWIGQTLKQQQQLCVTRTLKQKKFMHVATMQVSKIVIEFEYLFKQT